MYAAIDKHGKLHYAQELSISNKELWFCPKCHQRVELFASRRGKRYFKHVAKQTSHKGESSTHQYLKEILTESFNKINEYAISEQAFASVDRIADIYLPERQIIIEIQHTPISSKILRERTIAYQEMNFQTIWLMTDDVDQLTYRHQWQWQLLQYHPELKYYRLVVTNEPDPIRIDWDFSLLNQGKLIYKQTYLPVDVLLEFDIDAIKRHFKKVSMSMPRQSLNYEQKLAQIKREKSYRKVLNKLYAANIQLEELPRSFITGPFYLIGNSQPAWKWLAWLWQYHQMGEMDVFFHLEHISCQKKLSLVDQPFISRSLYFQHLSNEVENLFNQ